MSEPQSQHVAEKLRLLRQQQMVVTQKILVRGVLPIAASMVIALSFTVLSRMIQAPVFEWLFGL